MINTKTLEQDIRQIIEDMSNEMVSFLESLIELYENKGEQLMYTNMTDEQITEMLKQLEVAVEQWNNKEKNLIVTNRELRVLTTALFCLQDLHKDAKFEDDEVRITKQLLERIDKLQGEK